MGKITDEQVANEATMLDHTSRFWSLLKNENVRILVELRRDTSSVPYWDSSSFPDAVAKALVNDRAALSAASALTSGEREPVGVRCTGCGSSWDDERLAKELLNNPALRSCCPERDPQPVYYSPPASELEALRAQVAGLRNSIRDMQYRSDGEFSRAETAEARLAEALRALDDVATASDKLNGVCTLTGLSGQMQGNLYLAVSAARRVRDGGQADG